MTGRTAKAPRKLVTIPRWLGLCAVVVAGACASDPIELTVDLRTDWQPLSEFVAVQIDLFREPGDAGPLGSNVVTYTLRGTEDFVRGQRVAEYLDVPEGHSFVRVSLLNRAGGVLAERIVDLELSQSYALTVVMTRNCRDVVCPGSGDAPSLRACLDSRCVDPRCRPDTPEYCPPTCEADADCMIDGCAEARCTDGTCLCERLSACYEAGRECDADANQNEEQACGSCALGLQSRSRTCNPETCTWSAWSDFSECLGGGACDAGTVEPETQACGNCSIGSQSRTRTCDSACAWGAWTDWSACAGGGACVAGAVENPSQACGNCSTGTQNRRRTCDSACNWGAWSSWTSCVGGGACAPGATRGGCDSCGEQRCTSSCTWGSTCYPTNQCLYNAGRTFRCCGAGLSEFCLSSCRWSGVCNGTCTSCGC